MTFKLYGNNVNIHKLDTKKKDWNNQDKHNKSRGKKGRKENMKYGIFLQSVENQSLVKCFFC